MSTTLQSSPTRINPYTQDLYAHNENGEHNLIYFLLDTSRHEPALKRTSILMSAGKLVKDEPVRDGCSDLANELMDVEQIAQKHLALIRELCAEEILENGAWGYLLERLENQPLETKMELLGSITGLEGPKDMRLHNSWCNLHHEVNKFSHAFESFLHKLRTRFYQGTNREALAAFRAEEAAEKAAASHSATEAKTV